MISSQRINLSESQWTARSLRVSVDCNVSEATPEATWVVTWTFQTASQTLSQTLRPGPGLWWAQCQTEHALQ